MNKPITIQNHNFTLHPSGAMYWHEREMLLISDVHLGKVSHFRKHGSAVPKKAIAKNFEKLQDVIQSFAPKVICFLGDLFHSINLFGCHLAFHLGLNFCLTILRPGLALLGFFQFCL